MRVGLTGGIGAGKSEVARIFAGLGALVVDADALAREAVAPGSDGLAAIAARWPTVILQDGTLNRAALAALIFDDEAARSTLNAIVHPIVRRLAATREATARPGQLVVHEVPLLFETGYAERCDATVLVRAPREARIARVAAGRGWSRDDIERRMEAQIDPAEAARRADYIIENDGPLERLAERSGAVYGELIRTGATR